MLVVGLLLPTLSIAQVLVLMLRAIVAYAYVGDADCVFVPPASTVPTTDGTRRQWSPTTPGLPKEQEASRSNYFNVTMQFVTKGLEGRRIRQVRVGRLVRIPTSSISEFVARRTANEIVS